MAQAHASMIEFMEQALVLLNEELALDPITFWHAHRPTAHLKADDDDPVVDEGLLVVRFHGQSCFLGNTLPFRFLVRLARHPNIYLSYEDLLDEVWEGVRSDEAVRSVVKRLRSKLRQNGMADLANAIDGSEPGRYALKIDSKS